MASKDFSVRVGQEEIGRIFNLKENLDLKDLLVTYAPHYQQLGWVLVGMKSPEGAPLEFDLSQPADLWSQQLSEMGADQGQINIGIRTGKASNLLVLEVNRGEGALSLDQCGEWRADCVAEMGGCREQHYYTLPLEAQTPPSFFLAPQVLIYGEGGLVLAPPSLEPLAREPWRWLRPPWEAPPLPPKPAVWQFLKEFIPAAMVKPEVQSWEEIYRMIAPHGCMLKALLVPPTSQDKYYQGIIGTALGLGFKDPALLFGLLWHAPHGEARQNPEKRDYFQELVARARDRQEGGASVPGLPARIDGGAWPDKPASHLEIASQGAQEVLDMLSGSGSTDPKGQERETASTPQFDQSVSGQFFQLLAGLGEKVIMESCRYEAMLTGVHHQAGEIDSLVSQWEQYFAGSAPSSPEPGQKPAGTTVEFNWDAIVGQPSSKKQQIQKIQTAAGDFLNQNPDLAGDRHKVQMVIFCLKNYVSINPENAALPFREKLDQAGIMAREYLRMQHKV
ncbi:MAG: bifunctional DNA primase/polymerase [Deltaproteobacteria bacterium]|nr:bifunctional DNA primase/polymerase [Deltaproteobacteria bacterium]